ncbi:4Fe-4S dicluster domain-containing protein [Parasedimentitalea maritima]|uniref:4Fe-4S dicluster domain-containing protein n=2 Tax=Parasedimentitalea maritima TaxID=2578117 RepID=A0A6A4RL21_9RHOB|nr:4Fe-4S dicluster domain-containing protein [Zongyanglinia marina]
MSDWKRSSVCLCHSSTSTGSDFCLRSVVRKHNPAVDVYHSTAGETALPLLGLCEAAHEERKSDQRTHVLILHTEAGHSDVSQVEWFDRTARVHAVQICDLERIGHVDLLLALALGFDFVLLQKLPLGHAAADQSREVELAQMMGGKRRLKLFGSQLELRNSMAELPRTGGSWAYKRPFLGPNRRATARACATVLMPTVHQPLNLPQDAPYGTVELDLSACTMCQSCVWLCPTDALSIGEHKCELVFVESHCIQCGMCQSICPEDALKLRPRIDPQPSADTQQILHQVEPFKCTSCGVPFVAKSMMDRLLARIWGRKGVQASEDVQELIPLCHSCQIQKQQGGNTKRAPMMIKPRQVSRQPL